MDMSIGQCIYFLWPIAPCVDFLWSSSLCIGFLWPSASCVDFLWPVAPFVNLLWPIAPCVDFLRPITPCVDYLSPMAPHVVFMLPIAPCVNFLWPITPRVDFLWPIAPCVNFLWPIAPCINVNEYSRIPSIHGFVMESWIMEKFTNEPTSISQNSCIFQSPLSVQIKLILQRKNIFMNIFSKNIFKKYFTIKFVTPRGVTVVKPTYAVARHTSCWLRVTRCKRVWHREIVSSVSSRPVNSLGARETLPARSLVTTMRATLQPGWIN